MNPLVLPLLLIAIVLAYSIWPNTSYLIEFFQVWPLYSIVFGVFLPLLLWMLGKLKRHRAAAKKPSP
ncbi:hypothetical protein [Paenibacillus ginsengarvi]|uniref:Uncharacterized protein n=1 Tax=Paenibacillus ginsengarvi TaxID=400777 RepID=A0A3B0B7F2_9BACL|nr:hypothetical protein [Paenibacillus ginsengarvi]RKN70045.1 hypothetical protein D7M11_30950 [Paenibacillus ginsengarvi]